MNKPAEIIAYKAFFKGLTNDIDGIQYEIGKPYTTPDRLLYQRGGYHMCKQFEDCYKFLKATETEIDLTLVKGFGNYYGVDGGERSPDDSTGIIYMCEKMEILKVLSRDEIIQLALELPPYRMQSFLYNYPLLKEEKDIIMSSYTYGTNDLKFIAKRKTKKI